MRLFQFHNLNVIWLSYQLVFHVLSCLSFHWTLLFHNHFCSHITDVLYYLRCINHNHHNFLQFYHHFHLQYFDFCPSFALFWCWGNCCFFLFVVTRHFPNILSLLIRIFRKIWISLASVGVFIWIWCYKNNNFWFCMTW